MKTLLATLLLITSASAFSSSYYDLNLSKKLETIEFFSLVDLCRPDVCAGVKLTIPQNAKIGIKGHVGCVIENSLSAVYGGGDSYIITLKKSRKAAQNCVIEILTQQQEYALITLNNERAGTR